MLGSTVQGNGRGRKRGEEALRKQREMRDEREGKVCVTLERERRCCLVWRHRGKDRRRSKRQASLRCQASSMAATRMEGISMLAGQQGKDALVMQTGADRLKLRFRDSCIFPK